MNTQHDMTSLCPTSAKEKKKPYVFVFYIFNERDNRVERTPQAIFRCVFKSIVYVGLYRAIKVRYIE